MPNKPQPSTSTGQAVRELIEHARSEKRDLLLSESMQVLEHYGIPTAVGVRASTVEEARAGCRADGLPGGDQGDLRANLAQV